jgi:hypothetical protein
VKATPRFCLKFVPQNDVLGVRSTTDSRATRWSTSGVVVVNYNNKSIWLRTRDTGNVINTEPYHSQLCCLYVHSLGPGEGDRCRGTAPPEDSNSCGKGCHRRTGRCFSSALQIHSQVATAGLCKVVTTGQISIDAGPLVVASAPAAPLHRHRPFSSSASQKLACAGKLKRGNGWTGGERVAWEADWARVCVFFGTVYRAVGDLFSPFSPKRWF